MNRALADAAEAHGPGRWEESLRAAVWRLDGGGTARPDLMIDAARQAYAAHDNRLAERLARAVVGTEHDAEAGLLLADLLEEQGRHEDAEALYARIERGALDDASRSMAALGRAIVLFWGLARPEDASRVLDEMRAHVTDGVWRDELAAQQATFEPPRRASPRSHRPFPADAGALHRPALRGRSDRCRSGARDQRQHQRGDRGR